MLLLEYKPIFECSHCSQIFLYSNFILYNEDDITLCKNCINDHYFKCHDCDILYKHDDIDNVKIDGYFYCADCYNDNYNQCCNCDSHTLKDEGFYFNDDFYCEDCYNENFVYCEECEDMIEVNHSQCANGSYYCNDCYNEKYGQCNDCGNTESWDYLYYNEYDDCYYCENCYCEHNVMEFDSKPVSLENNSFNDIKYTQCFGIELEISASDIPYNDIDNYTCFGSQSDCTINDSNGSEIVSPILQGDIGYNKIKELCEYVENCDNDDSTGYHLHIDYRDRQDFRSIKNTWVLYHRIEKLLYAILPPSRQDNSYCYKQKLPIHYILECEDMEELRQLFYSPSNENGSRYFGINLHSIFTNRTLEIRCHNGTSQFKKIIEWININLAIVNFALDHDINAILELTRNITTLEDFTRVLSIIGCNADTIEYYKARYHKFNKFSLCNTLG